MDLLGVSVGIVLILHGLLYLQGLIVYLGLGSIGGWPRSTALLYGDIKIGEAGDLIYGLLWGLAAVGFVVAGVAVFTLRQWWWTLTLGTALLSLVVTVLGLPHSAGGVVLNVLILAYLILGRRYCFLPSREDSEDTSAWPWGE